VLECLTLVSCKNTVTFTAGTEVVWLGSVGVTGVPLHRRFLTKDFVETLKLMSNHCMWEINRGFRDGGHNPFVSGVREQSKQAVCRKIIVYRCLTAFTVSNLTSQPLPSLNITYRAAKSNCLPFRLDVQADPAGIWLCLISINFLALWCQTSVMDGDVLFFVNTSYEIFVLMCY